MRVLALDSSTSQGSVAVVESGNVVFAEAFECPRGRGGAFFESLGRAVKAGLPDRVAVGLGPGSYNGLRTAVTAAEALALAVGAERVGVVSLLALPVEAEEFVAIADARGGTLSFARVRNRQLVGEIELLGPDAVRRRLGAEPVFSPAKIDAFPEAEVATPDAAELARLGARMQPGLARLEPLYLKPVHITQPRRGG